jgi:hypothetical protein
MNVRAAAIALLFAIAAHAFCEISPEIAIGAPARRTPNEDGPSDAVIASDGTDFLVLWRTYHRYDSPLRVALVRRDGTVHTSFDLTTKFVPAEATVVWSGASYVVIINEGHSPSKTIKVIRLDRDGRIIEQARQMFGFADLESVAANGSRILITYVSPPTEYVEWHAAVLDSQANVISDHLLRREKPEEVVAAAHGNGWVLAVSDTFRRTEVLRLESDGRLSGDPPVLLGRERYLRLASDGEDVLVVSFNRDAKQGNITLIAGDEWRVVRQTPSNDVLLANLFWTGSEYLAVHRLAFIRIARDATSIVKIAAPAIPTGNASTIFAAGFNGNELLVARGELMPLFQSPVLLANIVSAATFQRTTLTFPLKISAARQEEPSIAYGASMRLITWVEPTGTYFARVADDGRQLDGSGVLLSPQKMTTRAVFDGEQFVVVMWRRGTIVARFISPDGMSGAELPIGSSRHPVIGVASGGNGTLVAWIDGQRFSRVRAAHIDRATNMLSGPPIFVSPPAAKDTTLQSPSVAWNGREFLVTWAQFAHWHEGFHQWDVRALERVQAARVTEGLLVRDPEPIVVAAFDPYAWPHTIADPRVASNGTDWLVAWSDERLRAQRIAADGTVEGPPDAQLVADKWFPEQVEITWDGAAYAVAARPEGSHLTLARIPASGAVRPLAEELVALGPLGFAIAGDGAGRVSIAYVRYAGEPPFDGTHRLFLRTIAPAR